MITDQKEVAETISNYSINDAVDIGHKIKPDCGYGDHPGVKIIREHLPQNQILSCRHKNLTLTKSKKGNWPRQNYTKTY